MFRKFKGFFGKAQGQKMEIENEDDVDVMLEPLNMDFDKVRMDIIKELTLKDDELLLGAFGNEDKKAHLHEYIKQYLIDKNIVNLSSEILVNSICGLMFIEDIIKDEDITDISWNGTELWVQHNKKGRYLYDADKLNDKEVGMLINKIGNSINKSCNASTPTLDAEYPMLRVQATHKSIAPYGQTFSMRVVRPKLRYNPKDSKDIPQELFKILESCMKSNCNILVSGITGSGKTEFQKWLIGHIDDNEKIFSAEDTLELHIKTLYPQKDIMSFKTTSRTSYIDLVKVALRNNADWIIIAETRGAEAYDMIKAVQTGHNVITTVHSISARDSVDRLVHMCKEKYELDQVLLGQIISRGFDIGIHLDYTIDENGVSRYVTEIVQYTNYTDKGLEYDLLYELEFKVNENTDEITKNHNFYPISKKIEQKLIKANQIKALQDYANLVKNRR